MSRANAALACCAALLLAGCGDGIREGVNEGAGNRGTIDGVVLHPPESVAVTEPTGTPSPGTGSPDTGPPDTGATPDGTAFGWTAVGDGVDEGHLDVPLDHDRPDGPTVQLYLVRHRAADPAHRIGTLLVNPGGPGYGGSGLAFDAESIYGQDLLDRFDIVGWDPRGTGSSAPAVDCVTDDDRYFAIDTSPDDEAERRLLTDRATEFADACERSNGDLLAHLSTDDSARDIDLIRRALGERTISYFGFSYGSELGATWATLFPGTVRAAVLDGAVDPTVDYFEQSVQQAAGFEAAFDRFLAACSADRACAFHHGGDAAAAFDRLAAAIDRSPVAAPMAGRPAITQGVLDTAIASAMYDEAAWPQLEQALADLEQGDGTGVLDLYDQYYGYYGDEFDPANEAYFATNCLDDPGTTSPAALFAREGELAAAAPRLGRSWLGELAICSVWPTRSTTPRVRIDGAGAGPILVVGTTGDPATPLAGTRAMAHALEGGRLVVVDAQQHTGYGVNRCVDDTVDGYLLDPSRPLPAETDCA